MDTKKSFNTPPIILGITVITALISLLLFFWFVGKSNGFSLDATDWGVFGDYLGGVIGTVVSVATLYFVYLTYSNQTKLLIQSQFETSFFSLLNHQNNLLNSLSDDFSSTESKGQSFISKFADSLEINIFDSFYYYKHFTGESINQSRIRHDINKEFEITFNSWQNHQLGAYFRHVYNILLFIDESGVDNKQKYCNLLYAQMSDRELFAIFYNCISDRGFDKFKPLADKYKMFENMESTGFVFEKHCKIFYPNIAFKYKSEGNSHQNSKLRQYYSGQECDFDSFCKRAEKFNIRIFVEKDLINENRYHLVLPTVINHSDEKYIFLAPSSLAFEGEGSGRRKMKELFNRLYGNSMFQILLLSHKEMKILIEGTKYPREILLNATVLSKNNFDNIPELLKDGIREIDNEYHVLL